MTLKQLHNKKKLKSIKGYKRLVLLVAPFVQLYFSIISIDLFNYNLKYVAVGLSLIVTFLLLVVFFQIATNWLKALMILCILLAVFKLISIDNHFNTNSIKRITNKIKGRSEITVTVSRGIYPHDKLALIDLEKKLSSTQGVDSLFIYGLSGLNYTKILFKPKDELCHHYGVNGLDVVKYADSIYASTEQFNTSDLYNLKYKEFPLSALVDMNVIAATYKPELFKSEQNSGVLIKENEIKFILHCSSKTENTLRTTLQRYIDSTAKDLPLDMIIKLE